MTDNDQIKEPVIFIPGVRKCGTTTLFSALEKHTRISAPRYKEPQYFALSPVTVAENLDWYRKLFTHVPDPVLIDGSTLCFLSSESARLIDQYMPNVKVIIMLRDPAKRAYSAYLHMYRQVYKGGETRTFDEVLDAMESREADVSLIEREREVIDSCVDSGSINGNYYTSRFHRETFEAPFDTDFNDNLIGYRYFEESCYSQYIGRYQDIFGDRMKIIFFERLVESPAETISEILRFVGLDIQKEVLQLPHENKGRIPNSAFSTVLIRLRYTNPSLRTLAGIIKRSPISDLGKKLLASLWNEGLAFSPEHRLRTQSLLTEEYDYWLERYPELNQYWVAGATKNS